MCLSLKKKEIIKKNEGCSQRITATCFDDVKLASSALARGSKHGERLTESLYAVCPEGFGFVFQSSKNTFYLTFGSQRCACRASRSTGFI